MSEFKKWYEENKEAILDMYFESDMVDKDMLSKFEDFLELAYDSGVVYGKRELKNEQRTYIRP